MTDPIVSDTEHDALEAVSQLYHNVHRGVENIDAWQQHYIKSDYSERLIILRVSRVPEPDEVPVSP